MVYETRRSGRISLTLCYPAHLLLRSIAIKNHGDDEDDADDYAGEMFYYIIENNGFSVAAIYHPILLGFYCNLGYRNFESKFTKIYFQTN